MKHENISSLDFEVAIPVKKTSTRLKNKNLKPFYKNHSLLDIKLKQTLKLISENKIIVFTDSEKAIEIAKKFNVQHQFVNDLSNNEWPESVDIMSDRVQSEYLMIHRVTTPYLGPKQLNQFIQDFLNNKVNHDSAVTVIKIQSQLLDSHAHPLNFGLGYNHVNSQDTEPIFDEICGTSIVRSDLARQYHYHYDDNPLLHCVDVLHGIDINNAQDFKCAQQMIANKQFSHELCLERDTI